MAPRKPAGNPPAEDNQTLQGFPQDGDEYIDNIDDTDVGDPDPEPDEPDEDPLAGLTRQVEALRRDNEALKKQIPPAQPKPAGDPPKDTDWNNLLFTDPKEAVKQIKKEAREEITRELRGEYTRNESQRAFWRKFYTKNKDLRQDHDLVELTLNGNLGELANIPVETAMERLGDLTRQRILRYTGKAASNRGNKARVEGSGAPTPPRQTEEDNEPVRLSDIIKARRAKRASAA